MTQSTGNSESSSTVEDDVPIAGRQFRRRITTPHRDGKVMATTLFHGKDERSIGGSRFGVTNDEKFAKLASCMTDKCIVAGVPASGQKTEIVAPSTVIEDPKAKIEILAEHIRFAIEYESNGIWGPDGNANETIMDGVADHGLANHICGLSQEHGGLGIDDNGFTAAGVHEAIKSYIENTGIEVRIAMVQGFGAVGAHTSRLLHDDGISVVAVSNAIGTIGSSGGLPIPELFAAWHDGGDRAVIATAHQYEGLVVTDNPNDLYQHRCDVFVPASTIINGIVDESELDRTTNEHRDKISAQQMLKMTEVRLIAEGANEPLSRDASRYLENHGIGVLPDFVINSGGLIGCYLDWEARNKGSEITSVQDGLQSVRVQVRNVLEGLGYTSGIRERAEKLAEQRRRIDGTPLREIKTFPASPRPIPGRQGGCASPVDSPAESG